MKGGFTPVSLCTLSPQLGPRGTREHIHQETRENILPGTRAGALNLLSHNGGVTGLRHELWKELVPLGTQSGRSETVPSATIPRAPKGPWPGRSSDTKYEIMSTIFSPHGRVPLWGVPLTREVCGTVGCTSESEPRPPGAQEPHPQEHIAAAGSRRRPRARHKPGA